MYVYTWRARTAQMTDNKRKRRDDFPVTDFENRFSPFLSPSSLQKYASICTCGRTTYYNVYARDFRSIIAVVFRESPVYNTRYLYT